MILITLRCHHDAFYSVILLFETQRQKIITQNRNSNDNTGTANDAADVIDEAGQGSRDNDTEKYEIY